MGACRRCGRKGLFVLVNSRGLCSACAPAVSSELAQRQRIINESLEIINKSKNVATQLSRCDVILEHLRALQPYKEAGILPLEIRLADMVETVQNVRKELVVTSTLSEVHAIMEKARLSPSLGTRVGQATKALLKIGDARNMLAAPSPQLDEAEKEVNEFIRSTRLNSCLETAQKAEFKGQIPKALDQYLEALYLLRTDEIPDEKQAGQIAEIEGRVARLRNAQKTGSVQHGVVPEPLMSSTMAGPVARLRRQAPDGSTGTGQADGEG